MKYIGIRSGEKIHEEMITANESQRVFDIGKYYVILPNNDLLQAKRKKQYLRFTKFKLLKYGFSYSSDNNSDFLSLADLNKLVNTFVKL